MFLFQVEEILEERTGASGSKEFLVKWKGYKKADSTWEPEEHLSCKDLIEAFYKRPAPAVSRNGLDWRHALCYRHFTNILLITGDGKSGQIMELCSLDSWPKLVTRL